MKEIKLEVLMVELNKLKDLGETTVQLESTFVKPDGNGNDVRIPSLNEIVEKHGNDWYFR